MNRKKSETKISNHILEELYTKMYKIRIFEERVAELLYKKEIICPVHLYVGQEAIAAGVCQNLNDNDYVFSTHRSHGHFIAKGGSLNELMAELYGKETGCSKGKGGSMHLVDPQIGFMGSSAIVAGSIPLAVGAAYTAKMNNIGQVSIAFFGDGGTDEGIFYESLNFASLYKLPVIFVCENNLFSTHLPIQLRHANIELSEIAESHKIKSIKLDGNDVIKVFNTVKDMVKKVRNGDGPFFMECMTFRWLAHVGPTPDLDIGYRKKKDVEYWMERCPIKKIKNFLRERDNYDIGKLNDIENRLKEEVEESLKFAKESNYPEDSELYKHLFIKGGI